MALVGAIYALWTFYGAGREPILWGAVLLATGIPVYFLTKRARGSIPPAAAQEASPPGSSA